MESHQQNAGAGSSKLLSFHRQIEKQVKSVRANFVRTLEHSKTSIATKQMWNQGKDNLKL